MAYRSPERETIVSKISIPEFEELARRELPLARQLGVQILEIEAGRARCRIPVNEDHLRPGGTIAGPVLMALADVTMYAVVLSLIGTVKLAVTTNLNCNFLRRPGPADVVSEGRVLKHGSRLIVGEVTMYSDGDASPIAHVTATYSVPPDGAGD